MPEQYYHCFFIVTLKCGATVTMEGNLTDDEMMNVMEDLLPFDGTKDPVYVYTSNVHDDVYFIVKDEVAAVQVSKASYDYFDDF